VSQTPVYSTTRHVSRISAEELDICITASEQEIGSDHFRAWQRDGYVDIWLTDTNNLDRRRADELVSGLEPLVDRLSGQHADVDDIITQARGFATDWLVDRSTLMRDRFVNSALIRVAGRTVEFTGAFAPAYIWEGGPVVRWTPWGTVWGAPHLLDQPAGQRGKYTLQIPAALVLASDGMLESRNEHGKINGDSLIINHFADNADPMSHLDCLFDSYVEKARTRDDSFQLLTMGTHQRLADLGSDHSLVMFKADAYESRVADDVESMLIQCGLSVEQKFRVRFTEEAVFALWPRIYGRRWTTSLLRSLPGRDLDVWLVAGQDAVTRVINVKDALRRRKSDVNSYKNLLHSPDSPVAFEREFAFLRQLKVTS
jgi:nucleoside diphosphate kinase